MDEASSLVKKIMTLGVDYEVMYLQGGASMQSVMTAMNLLESKAAYTKTVTLAKNAIKEAQAFGKLDVLGSSEDKNFSYIPKDFVIS